MTTARELMERIREQLLARQEDARALGAIYKFVLDGDGGGTWVVSLKDPVSVTEGDGTAECTIGLAASDFVDLFAGKANGQQLFFAGKLRIEGDFQLALKLERVTELVQG